MGIWESATRQGTQQTRHSLLEEETEAERGHQRASRGWGASVVWMVPNLQIMTLGDHGKMTKCPWEQRDCLEVGPEDRQPVGALGSPEFPMLQTQQMYQAVST